MKQQRPPHPADKMSEMQQASEILTMQMQTFEKSKERTKNTSKKVQITYKKLAANMIMLELYEVLPKTGLLSAAGTEINSSEETVFKVLMVGKKSDDYHIDVNPGDLVLLNMPGAMPQGHIDSTKILTDIGQEIYGYYLTSISQIFAVVGYEKLPDKVELIKLD